MNSTFRLLLADSPVIIDARLLHGGRTGIGRITKLIIETASKNKTVFVLGSNTEMIFDNVIYINTRCQCFGIIFLLQNLLLNLLFVKQRTKIIFPHYFSALCFLKKLVFAHDVMAITHYKYFHLRFALLKKYILTAVLKLGFVNADVASVSNYSCETIESLFGVKPVYLPNGTNLDVNYKFQDKAEPIVKSDKLPSRIVVGYVGNRRPHKNIPALKEFCLKNNFDLIFFDEFEVDVEHDDALLTKFYYTVDAVALFSYCEGFGIPIVEGALFGKYIFCSKIPAFYEFSEVGVNFVDSDTLISNIIKPNPTYVEQVYRFQKMKFYISNYIL